jgi:hypothetical protein
MKAHIAVSVTVDVAKVIRALTGLLVAIAYIFRY